MANFGRQSIRGLILRGDTIELGEIPKDMLNESKKGWQSMGVQLSDIYIFSMEEAARRATLRAVSKSVNEGNSNQ